MELEGRDVTRVEAYFGPHWYWLGHLSTELSDLGGELFRMLLRGGAKLIERHRLALSFAEEGVGGIELTSFDVLDVLLKNRVRMGDTIERRAGAEESKCWNEHSSDWRHRRTVSSTSCATKVTPRL